MSHVSRRREFKQTVVCNDFVSFYKLKKKKILKSFWLSHRPCIKSFSVYLGAFKRSVVRYDVWEM